MKITPFGRNYNAQKKVGLTIRCSSTGLKTVNKEMAVKLFKFLEELMVDTFDKKLLNLRKLE